MISEDQMASLQQGDRIRIVDCWAGGLHNSSGLMDEYLGETLTVASVNRQPINGLYCRVDEDGGRWLWFAEMIDAIISDEPPKEYTPVDDDAVAWLFAPEEEQYDG